MPVSCQEPQDTFNMIRRQQAGRSRCPASGKSEKNWLKNILNKYLPTPNYRCPMSGIRRVRIIAKCECEIRTLRASQRAARRPKRGHPLQEAASASATSRLRFAHREGVCCAVLGVHVTMPAECHAWGPGLRDREQASLCMGSISKRKRCCEVAGQPDAFGHTEAVHGTCHSKDLCTSLRAGGDPGDLTVPLLLGLLLAPGRLQ